MLSTLAYNIPLTQSPPSHHTLPHLHTTTTTTPIHNPNIHPLLPQQPINHITTPKSRPDRHTAQLPPPTQNTPPQRHHNPRSRHIPRFTPVTPSVHHLLLRPTVRLGMGGERTVLEFGLGGTTRSEDSVGEEEEKMAPYVRIWQAVVWVGTPKHTLSLGGGGGGGGATPPSPPSPWRIRRYRSLAKIQAASAPINLIT